MSDVNKSVFPVHLSGENVIHRLKVILLKLSLNGPCLLDGAACCSRPSAHGAGLCSAGLHLEERGRNEGCTHS